MADAFADILRAEIPGAMDQFNVPGCAVALIHDFQLADVLCFGTADRLTNEAVTSRTRFSLQSISKSIAAWMVLRLVEEGRIDLDRPIGDYLRRWTLPPSAQFDLALVTPRRLLSHHAGVTVAGFRGVALDQTSFTLIDAMQGKLPPPTPQQEQHYAYWNLPRDDAVVTLTHAPGSGWNYSNAGFGLLELAIEDITGEDFGTIVEQTIFAPLGMTNSCYGRRDGLPYASPHDRQGEPTPDYRWLCGAAGGAYASIEDLATFARAGMYAPRTGPGAGVLTPASVQTMHTAHGDADDIGELKAGAGLGHILLDFGGLKNVHHSGGSIGWRSIYSIYPQLGSGICMLMNAEGANELWQPLVFRWAAEQRAAA